MENTEKCSVCGNDLVDCVCSEHVSKKPADNGTVRNTTGGWGGVTQRTISTSGGGMFNSVTPRKKPSR